MSLSDIHILPFIYGGLATPPISPPLDPHISTPRPWIVQTSLPSVPCTPLNLSPTSTRGPFISTQIDGTPSCIPNSLQPAQFALPISRRPTLLHIDPPADSLTRERKGKLPVLSHLLSVGHSGRVLALAGDTNHVYAGCQSAENEIVVFSRTSLQPLYRLLGHQGSILALMVVEEKGWLVSSSSAGDVRIWCTTNLEPKYIIHPCDDTAGDIYTLAWDDRAGGTLYFGATIEWVNFGASHQARPAGGASASVTVPILPNGVQPPAAPSQRTGRYRPHHFFDNPPSNASSGSSTPRITSCKPLHNTDDHVPGAEELEVSAANRLSFAHYGYVYTLQIITQPDGSRLLASGSGDSDVKVYRCAEAGNGLEEIRHFKGLPGAVLSFAYRDSLLYAGLQEGEIAVWDLETGALIRNIQAHAADVLTMSVLGTEVYTAAADGRVLRVNQDFDCTAAFRAHSGIILSSIIVKGLKTGWELITAGNDSYVKIWTIDESKSAEQELSIESEGDVMLYALAKLVSVPTVSDEAHRESCRQGAHLLKRILAQLGARAEMLSGEQGRNPLVLATFTGTKPSDSRRKRLLFYGHYDVQPAAESDWDTNPWELSGRNGYLYGRGVSDNKGPILAVACAAAALQKRRELDVDLVMLLEGEEEAGSRGFAATVRNHKVDIGHIDAILLSNSTWIGESDPCIVFGMRGVVYANLVVQSHGEDAHSGLDGGIVAEPMFDMVRILGAIAKKHDVKLPGFYDSVRKSTPEEMRLLEDVAKVSDKSVDELAKVWRQPSFSIANISASGTSNKTVIPGKVTADISMRIVPDQDLGVIVETLKSYCREVFDGLESGNQFDITVTHSASWWLTSLDSPYFKALELSVEEVWGQKPLKIREGGTVPTIFWLEQEFQAPCVHLPLGQSSDAGHLANERMRLLNLRNGKRVVENFLGKLGAISAV